MTAPSGKGRFPSRKALIATSLPRIARRSLRVPSSWATEINGQSRYPRGILTPETGAASPSTFPDVEAVKVTTPERATAAADTKTLRFMCHSFTIRASIEPDQGRGFERFRPARNALSAAETMSDSLSISLHVSPGLVDGLLRSLAPLSRYEVGGVPLRPVVLRRGPFVFAMVLLCLLQKRYEGRDIHAAEPSSRKPRLDLLEYPTVAIRIAE